jgi:hypothetical protein
MSVMPKAQHGATNALKVLQGWEMPLLRPTDHYLESLLQQMQRIDGHVRLVRARACRKPAIAPTFRRTRRSSCLIQAAQQSNSRA